MRALNKQLGCQAGRDACPIAACSSKRGLLLLKLTRLYCRTTVPDSVHCACCTNFQPKKHPVTYLQEFNFIAFNFKRYIHLGPQDLKIIVCIISAELMNKYQFQTI